eukprot:CAMPEP_0175010618 /NCGR_PEP_ID=MMETSP0005-20121125/8196_1 /TAXON_ID=420556 /ORGANISM="Ochromonas sp., Strain CCMP1393" /LENGTH=83 /DNA_ID=CAMNT_0016266449 /DNA_START=1283 /DNA_END=1534 /DNA_ORIENTATION=-
MPTDDQHAAHVASILDSFAILRRLIPTYDQQLRQPQLPFAQDYAAPEQLIIAARSRSSRNSGVSPGIPGLPQIVTISNFLVEF